MNIHPMQAVAQDDVPVDLVNTGVDHICFHRTSQVMEDQSAGHVPALVNSGPLTCHLEGIFNTALVNNGFTPVSQHKVMVECPGEARQGLWLDLTPILT